MEYLKTRRDLLELLPKNSIGVEVGVFKGAFAQELLEVVSPSMVYLIDPWKGVIESGDMNGQNIEYIHGNDYYSTVILPKFGVLPNVEVLREHSDILNSFDDDSIDWIYIDADHQYPSVKYDLQLAYAKVKPNGYILGHDYNNDMCPGVVRAVDEFCNQRNLQIQYLTQDGCPSYFIQKI
jgi:hypothetical protein